MKTVLDVENSMRMRTFPGSDPWRDITPYHPDNKLVSYGLSSQRDTEGWHGIVYKCVNHSKHPTDADHVEVLQRTLDHTTLLIGHNLKHDLSWIFECGLKYAGELWDTQVAQYILLRGQKGPLSLKEVALLAGVTSKKSDLIEDYMKQGVSFENIPWDVVEEYGMGDIKTTRELYDYQVAEYNLPKNRGLLPTLRMSCEYIYVLVELERNGICIDDLSLGKVKSEYLTRYNELERSLTTTATKYMGDVPIQLTSPDFRSTLFFSRVVTDKPKWHTTFNIGVDHRGKANKPPTMNKSVFNNAVRAMTSVVKRKTAAQCHICGGSGRLDKLKKDGKPFINKPKCKTCYGVGVIYTPTAVVAGFKLVPRNTSDIANAGFKTSKETLEELQEYTTNLDCIRFIKEWIEYNAISTYLNTFVAAIKRFKYGDILHTQYNPTVTSTARLSSSNPNLQNMPRGAIFPVKRTFVSRFKGGSITEADYAGLEFRAAGALSKCPVVMRDIMNPKFDPHAFTRDTLNNFDPSLPQINRQDAKPHTFKPLYGGTSGSPREKTYYAAFLEKYTGVKEYHERLKSLAIQYKVITLPTGREYAFPQAKRLPGGYVFQTTQIVNWPVQGYATADIAPCGFIATYRLFKKAKLKSLLSMTTHDSLVADTHPGEEDVVVELMRTGMLAIPSMFKEFYDIDFTFPLAVEIKRGPNGLDLKVV